MRLKERSLKNADQLNRTLHYNLISKLNFYFILFTIGSRYHFQLTSDLKFVRNGDSNDDIRGEDDSKLEL